MFQQKPLGGAFGVCAEVRCIQPERLHPVARRTNGREGLGNPRSQCQKPRSKGRQGAMPLLHRPRRNIGYGSFIEHPHSRHDDGQEKEDEKHPSKQKEGKKQFLKVENPRSEAGDQEPACRDHRTFLSSCRHCPIFLRLSMSFDARNAGPVAYIWEGTPNLLAGAVSAAQRHSLPELARYDSAHRGQKLPYFLALFP